MYNEWLKSKTGNTAITDKFSVNETTYGLAADIVIMCKTCSEKECVKARQRESTKDTKSDLCKYNVNSCFILAMQQIGAGGEHAATVAAYLDLPDAHKWTRQFNISKQFMYPKVEALKCESQMKATKEEIMETLDLPIDTVPQFLLESDIPRHRVQASFEMGWQV
jgi:hypothetical protein